MNLAQQVLPKTVGRCVVSVSCTDQLISYIFLDQTDSGKALLSDTTLNSRPSDTQEDRPHIQAEVLCSLPRTLTSSYNRLHMRDSFCRLFYPEGREGTHDLFHQVYPATWAERLTLDTSDALCTLQVAISHTDREMLHASLKLHDLALRRLQSAVSRHARSSSPGSLVGAVYYLLKWESLMATSWDSPAWQFHLGALLKLLSQTKAEGHSKYSTPPRFLNFTFCYAMGKGLLSRKGVPWASVFQHQQSQLISSAFQVPPCLEQLDAARDHRSHPEQAKAAIEDGLRVRILLLEAISSYSLSSDRDNFLHAVDMSHYPDFEATLDGVLVKLYSTVYFFSSFEVALALKTLWTSLLVLDRTLSDLQQQYIPEVPGLGASDFSYLQAEIEMDECADHICRTLPYFSRPECKTSGALCIMEPLHFIYNHFSERNALHHMEWCRRARDAMVPGYKITRMLGGRGCAI